LIYKTPFRLAEKRRMSWDFGVCLSERSEFTPRQLIRASQGTRRASMRGPFLLVTFLWASKEKSLAHKGRNTHINSRNQIKKKTTQKSHLSAVR
jgi:hypothetical protein